MQLLVGRYISYLHALISYYMSILTLVSFKTAINFLTLIGGKRSSHHTKDVVEKLIVCMYVLSINLLKISLKTRCEFDTGYSSAYAHTRSTPAWVDSNIYSV